MPEDIRIWSIGAEDILSDLPQAKLDFEKRIEGWLERDITIIADDLLPIARQYQTKHGGIIDLLCLDRDGDIVIVELKRDKTPRDIVAQALDYSASIVD